MSNLGYPYGDGEVLVVSHQISDSTDCEISRLPHVEIPIPHLMFKISTKKVLFAVLQVILSISLMITALIVIAPLYPIMPSSDLDASSMYAINEAVADGFAFGREVIFPYGPYGAIYTRMFHPGTDALVMGAGLFF